MQLLGSFSEFTKRVVSAARLGRLPKHDIKKLERLLNRTGKRNTILAKGILSALSAGGASDQDINRFSDLLEKANHRITEDKEPFTEPEKKEIGELFKRAYVSIKAANWFASQIDELVAEEIEEFIKGKRSVVIPTKKFETV
ncbi:hypothetical protein J4450_01355 [Candidatus Micrarchaeota archaeon]|nr:hypothetical protein [Candidatus Micrarchaeota archaeon]